MKHARGARRTLASFAALALIGAGTLAFASSAAAEETEDELPCGTEYQVKEWFTEDPGDPWEPTGEKRPQGYWEFKYKMWVIDQEEITHTEYKWVFEKPGPDLYQWAATDPGHGWDPYPNAQEQESKVVVDQEEKGHWEYEWFKDDPGDPWEKTDHKRWEVYWEYEYVKTMTTDPCQCDTEYTVTKWFTEDPGDPWEPTGEKRLIGFWEFKYKMWVIDQEEITHTEYKWVFEKPGPDLYQWAATDPGHGWDPYPNAQEQESKVVVDQEEKGHWEYEWFKDDPGDPWEKTHFKRWTKVWEYEYSKTVRTDDCPPPDKPDVPVIPKVLAETGGSNLSLLAIAGVLVFAGTGALIARRAIRGVGS